MADEYVFHSGGVEAFSANGDVSVTMGGVQVFSENATNLNINAGAVEVFSNHYVPFEIGMVAVEVFFTDQQAYRVDALIPEPAIFAPRASFDEAQEFRPVFLNIAAIESFPGLPITFAQPLVAPPGLIPDPNPYRPDVPQTLQPELYDYLREHGEIQRDQHNLIQAGDTTYPWQLTSKPSNAKDFTLGSKSRFYHEQYGVIHATFVEFADDFTDAQFVGVGHHKKSTREYVVTDQASQTNSNRFVGVTLPFEAGQAGQWGWVLTQGRSPIPAVLESATRPEVNTEFTWDFTKGLMVVAAGPRVGTLVDARFIYELVDESNQPYSPPRWQLPVGSWCADVNGLTSQFYITQTNTLLAPLDARVTAIENELDEADIDYQSQIDALTVTVTDFRAVFDAHELANQLLFTSVTNRLLNIENQLDVLGSGGVDVSGLEARITNVEASALTNANEIASLTSRVVDLEYWQSTLADINAASVSVLASTHTVNTAENAQTAFDLLDRAVAQNRATGYVSGGGLTDLGAGVIRIALGEGEFLDDSDPALLNHEFVDWVETDLDLSAADGTYYIYVDSAGIVQSTTTAPTTADYGDQIWLYSVVIAAGIYDSHANISQSLLQWTRQLRAKLDDAPSDGSQYARKDGAWEEVAAGLELTGERWVKTVYTYTGADQDIVVPADATRMRWKIWGAGGSGGRFSAGGVNGGGGGFASGELPVTPGEAVKIQVPNGGTWVENGVGPGGWPDGGNGSWGDADGGGGGGSARLWHEGVLLSVAGGGGGAGGWSGGGSAGAGGGLSGTNAGGSGGTGGTQVAGGVDSNDTGNAEKTGLSLVAVGSIGRTGGQGGPQTGSTTQDGGGGGGGYWGGGGGGGDAQAGGGGSGYNSGSVESGFMEAGSGSTPGNNIDVDYVAGVGVGAASQSGGTPTIGGTGLAIVEFLVPGLALNDIADVDTATTPPTDGQALIWDDASGLWIPGDVASGGGGAGGGALIHIGSAIAAGGESILSVGSIPADHRNLVIKATARGSTASPVLVRFNGDSSAIYDIHRQFGGFGHGGNNTLNQTAINGDVFYMVATANMFASMALEVFEYAATDRHKSYVANAFLTPSSGQYTVNASGRWKSTDAINQVSIAPDSGTFEAGTRLDVYALTDAESGGGSSGPTLVRPAAADFTHLTKSNGSETITIADNTYNTGVHLTYAPGATANRGGFLGTPVTPGVSFTVTARVAMDIRDNNWRLLGLALQGTDANDLVGWGYYEDNGDAAPRFGNINYTQMSSNAAGGTIVSSGGANLYRPGSGGWQWLRIVYDQPTDTAYFEFSADGEAWFRHRGVVLASVLAGLPTLYAGFGFYSTGSTTSQDNIICDHFSIEYT